jgi:signal peptidase I
MHPTLEPGDWAIAIRARLVRPGDVVILEHPARPDVELVKRVTAVGGDIGADGEPLRAGEIWIEGDAPLLSTDSRSLGPARLEDVRGRVILVWWPPRRWRRV